MCDRDRVCLFSRREAVSLLPTTTTMKVFHHPDTLLHDPSHEILGGKETSYFESPTRITLIKNALEEDPDNFELSDSLDEFKDIKDWILKVHDPDYIDYLSSAYEFWVRDGGNKVCTNSSIAVAAGLSTHRKPCSQMHFHGSERRPQAKF